MIDRGEPSLGKRIRLLGQVEREPIAFVSPASEPANSIQDIIQRASDDADAVPLGTPPAGSPPHLAALRLQVLAQTQLNIVTFPSAEAARQAVLEGNVSAAALGLSAAIGACATATCRRSASRRGGGSACCRTRLCWTRAASRSRPLSAAASAFRPERRSDVVAAAGGGVAGRDRRRGVCRPGRRQRLSSGLEERRHLGADAEAEQAELAKLWETDPWL